MKLLVLFCLLAGAAQAQQRIVRLIDQTHAVTDKGDTLVRVKLYPPSNMPTVETPHIVEWQSLDDQPAEITRGKLKDILRRLYELEEPKRRNEAAIRRGDTKVSPHN